MTALLLRGPLRSAAPAEDPSMWRLAMTDACSAWPYDIATCCQKQRCAGPKPDLGSQAAHEVFRVSAQPRSTVRELQPRAHCDDDWPMALRVRLRRVTSIATQSANCSCDVLSPSLKVKAPIDCLIAPVIQRKGSLFSYGAIRAGLCDCH